MDYVDYLSILSVVSEGKFSDIKLLLINGVDSIQIKGRNGSVNVKIKGRIKSKQLNHFLERYAEESQGFVDHTIEYFNPATLDITLNLFLD